MDVSDKPMAATPPESLEDHVMNPNYAETEAEHWAAREIKRLREIEAESRFLVDRLRAYEADSCQCEDGVREWDGHVTPPLSRLQGLFCLSPKEPT